MNELTIMSQCFAQVRRVAKESPMYREKFKDIPVNTMMTKEQFETLPFTTKQDLRDAYPMGMQCVPNDKIVRVHSFLRDDGDAGHHALQRAGHRGLGRHVRTLLPVRGRHARGTACR